ncbi:GNAT family N-acetyltransferase [Thalassobacillus hwangdonensis]|uniref:GNAT family N-acetyltransferase n=1 Tax=Thalassobacillus hwangdonensis TaxID=546108 RepID=A0ABW3L3R4_9BACI
MTIKFSKMNEQDFKEFYDVATINFANDKINNGSWPEQTALEQSKEAFQSLLPDNEKTENHYLKNILFMDRKIGYMWYAINSTEPSPHAYLYEIFINPEFRGKGFGTEAMRLCMKEIEQKGIDDVWLHVFGHNHGALKLYQQLGFETTDYTMKASAKQFDH